MPLHLLLTLLYLFLGRSSHFREGRSRCRRYRSRPSRRCSRWAPGRCVVRAPPRTRPRARHWARPGRAVPPGPTSHPCRRRHHPVPAEQVGTPARPPTPGPRPPRLPGPSPPAPEPPFSETLRGRSAPHHWAERPAPTFHPRGAVAPPDAVGPPAFDAAAPLPEEPVPPRRRAAALPVAPPRLSPRRRRRETAGGRTRRTRERRVHARYAARGSDAVEERERADDLAVRPQRAGHGIQGPDPVPAPHPQQAPTQRTGGHRLYRGDPFHLVGE